jgi:hypothetical protein
MNMDYDTYLEKPYQDRYAREPDECDYRAARKELWCKFEEDATMLTEQLAEDDGFAELVVEPFISVLARGKDARLEMMRMADFVEKHFAEWIEDRATEIKAERQR